MRRRPPKPEKVRETLANVTANHWGEEIVRLRKDMSRALTCLYSNEPAEAQRILSKALAEGWWK